MAEWLESANGGLLLLVGFLTAIGALWRLVVQPLHRLADRASDLEGIRKALTPNSGTSMHDFVEDTRRAVSRVEEALHAHCVDAARRLDGVTHSVDQTNRRIDGLADSLAGVRNRRGDGDRPPGTRTRSTDEDGGQ